MNTTRGYIIVFRKAVNVKIISLCLIIIFILPMSIPIQALTNGPTQPESQGFSAMQQETHVDLTTGSFSYMIPLFSMNDYPFNLSYNSDITMEEEASWVGLGWNLNTGNISRNMRGLPDDFKDDIIVEEKNQKRNVNIGITAGSTFEIFTIPNAGGGSALSSSITFIYNNYTGISISQNRTFGFNFPNNIKANLGFSTGDGGLSISPNFSFNKKEGKNNGLGIGMTFNSLKGVQEMNFSYKGLSSSITNNELCLSPESHFPTMNTSFSFEPQIGGTVLALDYDIFFNATYNIQRLKFKHLESPSYGFLYMYGKTGGNGELLDFAREKDNSYNPGNPYLPQTLLQPDVFSVNTALFSDNFRAFQNSATVVSDAASISPSTQTNVDAGIEIGMGNLADIGLNFALNLSYNYINPWINAPFLYFLSQSQSNSFAKTTPFKNIYFKSINSPSASPISPNNNAQKFSLGGNNFGYTCNNNSSIFANKYQNIFSVREENVFLPVIKSQLQQHPLYHLLYQQYESPEQKSEHIAAIKIHNSEGKTFIFGCPTINYLQKEVSFNVENNQNSNFNPPALIAYNPSIEATTTNTKGIMNHFYSKTIPAYAYSYLLTELYNEEYSDLTGDGPSPDDAGDYITFSYAKKISKYKWRTPYTEQTNKASYNPNFATLFSNSSDDIASYTYGEKDIWYVDTVRSKHQMAIFYTSPRDDAYEAQSEHGGKGNSSMHKLDSIIVYTVHNYYQSLNAGTNIIPEQKIVFNYTYDLCKGVYNQSNINAGKLTLTEVIITDNNSEINQKHSYKFEYNGDNPDYNPEQIDRWGNYNNTSITGMNRFNFPYTTANDNNHSSAWRLTKINLPSGGATEIEYEPRTYSYVQNKKAMQMFQISGVSNDSDNINGNLGLYNDFYYVYFKTDIPHTLPLQEAQNEFNKYFDTDLKNNLYFKVLINTTPDTSYKDYVYGYAEILDAALINDNNQNQYYGRIQLKGVPIGKVNSQEVHPFSKAAIHSGMINTPNLTFGHPDYNNLIDQPLDFANQFIQDVFLNTSFLNNLIATFQGPQKNLYNNNVGKHIDTQKSIIRLLSRTDKKGGGSRVKKIIYNNSWADMTNQAESTSYLVKEYQYIKEDGTSSGVASYEPQLGGDEIPQHLPYTYNITHHTHVLNSWAKNLVSSPEYLSFYPIAESAFPSPAIYYERVVETNKAQNNLSNGYIVYHFFTTKDYPTIVNVSALQQKNPSFNLSLPFFHINKKHIAVSQGFTVINNDMNGKQKMVEYFDGNNILLKKITNSYNNNINGYTNFYCSSNNKNTKYSGLEKDVVVDLREESSVTSGGNVNANFNAFFVPFFPPISIFFSMFLFVPNYTESVFRSATVSQVYYKKAVLSKQLISDRGAVLDVFNLYRNPVTADPLITATKNQWDEKTYQYSLPAYYVYKQMGTSSPYTGHSFNMKTNAQGKIIQTNYIYLHDGDVVILPDTPACRFAWIYNTQLGKYLLDKDGNPITSSTFIGAYLWQSGYKNMLKPVVQTIQSKELPTFTGNLFQSYLATHDILNAQATKYIDYYSYRCTNCGCENNFVLDSTILNIGNGTPAVIRYYIESACNCDGSIILLPAYDQAGNPIHFFYNQQEITHIDSLCANTTITIYINNNSNQSFTITIPNGTQTITSYQTINPFIYKLKNAWRSYKDYVFISPREPQHTNTPIDLKNQGQYTNFVPFWYWDTNTWEKNESAWLFKECYNFADIHGNAIESYDMSNVYQAAGIAFKGKLQEFIAYNAHNSNIAFDGFEDYHPYYLNNATPQQPWQHKIDVLHTEHFRLSQHKPSWVSLEKPHTGYYSLQIPAHDSILKTTRVNDNILLNSPDTIYSIPFKITSEYCSDVFHLNNNTKYLYSFWYYGDSINYSSLASVSFLNGNNIPDTIDYISPAIEGWRQVTGHFTYQVTLAAIQCTKIIFSIINHTDSSIFIDDFRMHPYQANMKSFVYNPFNLLPVALLDENNFATIYQYDEQQQVQNIIKETEKGLIFIDYKKKHKMIK